jgi:hypothetical protein
MTDPDPAVFLTLPEALAWGQSCEPPVALRDFLPTLHRLCRSGRIHAVGRPSDRPYHALTPIPSTDWIDIWFDSDSEKLHCANLFSGILHRRRVWNSVAYSQVDLIREWPRAGAAALANEQADSYWGYWERQRRYAREAWRREWIDGFAEEQRRIRRWISFVEIVDVCARAAGPASTAEEDDLRSLTYRRLVESISRGEFEKDGKSQVLILFPDLQASIPPYRLTHEYFQAIVETYDMTDFTTDSGLVRDHLWFCWVPRDLCQAWFERHLLPWPSAFNPQTHALPIPPESSETKTELEISQPSARSARAPQKGRPGRLRGSGSFDDSQPVREMLRLLVNGEAGSVHAVARLVAGSNMVKKTGSEESAATRLRGKFVNTFGARPPPGKNWSDVAAELPSK